MEQEALNKAVSLALHPEEGAPFALGGKTFHLQFLNYDGEQRLTNLLMPRIKELVMAGATSHPQIMAALSDLLPEAVGIILNNYDPAIDPAWPATVREAGVSERLYSIVAAQFEMNELGKLLSGRLQSDVVLQAAEAAEA